MNRLPSDSKHELLVRSEEETSPKYGCLPHKRTIEQLLQNGVINLDKPPGPTSHKVTEYAKQILEAKKAGHAGTLDPKVTGVFPIGLNNGTKVMQALLKGGKEYTALMHLHDNVDEKTLKAVMNDFVGVISQKPPLRSSVKRVTREREIYYIDILEIHGKDILFKAGVEAGTYIRMLCHDIGKKLGTGAHMQQLRRTRSGPFGEDDIVNLHTLKDVYYFWKEDGIEKTLRKVVHPMEAALKHLPRIIISDNAIDSVCHGAQLAIPGILKVDSGIKEGDMTAVFTQKGEGVLLARALKTSEQILKQKKGFAVKTERVLMNIGVYPK